MRGCSIFLQGERAGFFLSGSSEVARPVLWGINAGASFFERCVVVALSLSLGVRAFIAGDKSRAN